MYENMVRFSEDYTCTTQLFKSITEVDKLLEKDIYKVSFDQSTTCTGITIINSSNTRLYLIEVKRERGATSWMYTVGLEKFLIRQFEDCIVSDMFYEAPLDSKGYETNLVLHYLAGMLHTLPIRSEAFSYCQLNIVNQPEWWTAIVGKDVRKLGTNKELSKAAIVGSFPFLKDYGDSLNKDNDVFESVGVMFGGMTCRLDFDKEIYLDPIRYQKFDSLCVVFPPDFDVATVPNRQPKEYPIYSVPVRENIATYLELNTVFSYLVVTMDSRVWHSRKLGLNHLIPDRCICVGVSSSDTEAIASLLEFESIGAFYY